MQGLKAGRMGCVPKAGYSCHRDACEWSRGQEAYPLGRKTIGDSPRHDLGRTLAQGCGTMVVRPEWDGGVMRGNAATSIF